MKNLETLRTELDQINKRLNALIRKYDTPRKRANASLSEKVQALNEMKALDERKGNKLLVICAINRPHCFN